MAREIGIGPRFYGVPFYSSSVKKETAIVDGGYIQPIVHQEDLEGRVVYPDFTEEAWAAKSPDGHSIPWPTA